MLEAIITEDAETRKLNTIGECLEFTLKQGLLLELVAYGKSDKPEGLLEMVINFINYLLVEVQSTQLLNHQEVHPAIMQLLFHLENSIKNNMLVGADTDDLRDSRQKQIMGSYIIDLLLTLSKKSLQQPSLVNFLFSDSRQGSRKGAYMPMQVLLQLLMREQMRDDDYLKATLRHCLVLQLRIPSLSVRTYLLEDSELT